MPLLIQLSAGLRDQLIAAQNNSSHDAHQQSAAAHSPYTSPSSAHHTEQSIDPSIGGPGSQTYGVDGMDIDDAIAAMAEQDSPGRVREVSSTKRAAQNRAAQVLFYNIHSANTAVLTRLFSAHSVNEKKPTYRSSRSK